MENFTYSILEIFDVKTKREDIIQREEFWKKVFQSVKHGFNRNRLDDSARVARCRRHLPMRNSAMRRRLHQQGDCDSL